MKSAKCKKHTNIAKCVRNSVHFNNNDSNFCFFFCLFACCHCSGDHVEIISIDFDPNEVTYLELLNLFWNNHEYGLGTRVKRQYQSIIFYHDEKQKQIATESLEYERIHRPDTPITTQIIKASTIYTAEE